MDGCKARLRVSTGNTYERNVGYARVVRVGDHVVAALADPRMLVEIEAEALIGSAAPLEDE